MRRPLFVTATNTGIGKSVVSACIINALKRDGHNVFPFKPVQSGCLKTVDDFNANDALLLKSVSDCDAPLQEINPYSFSQPVSPHFAARQEHAHINAGQLLEVVKSKLEKNIVVIEGAGGIATPLADDISNADLAKAVGAVVIIVTTPILGTINHTMLTLEYIRLKDIITAGIIVNQWPRMPTPAERESVNYICKKGYCPVLGYVEDKAGLDLNDPLERKELLDEFYLDACHSGLLEELLDLMNNRQ